MKIKQVLHIVFVIDTLGFCVLKASAQLIPIIDNLQHFPLSFNWLVSLNVAMATTRSVISVASILNQMPYSRPASICGVMKRTASYLVSWFRKATSLFFVQLSGGLPSMQMMAPFFKSITSFAVLVKRRSLSTRSFTPHHFSIKDRPVDPFWERCCIVMTLKRFHVIHDLGIRGDINPLQRERDIGPPADPPRPLWENLLPVSGDKKSPSNANGLKGCTQLS